MISGGRVDSSCLDVRNTPLRVDDFNFDGQLDQLKDERCKSSKEPVPDVWLHMSAPSGGSRERWYIDRVVKSEQITGFSLGDHWRWKMGVAKDTPLFSVGDEVMTPLGERGRLYGFLIYFDPEFNVIQRTATVQDEKGEEEEFDLSEVTLLSPISDLDAVATGIAELTKLHFGEELRRIHEILEIADYRYLKEEARAEVDRLNRAIVSHVASYIEEPALDRDGLSQRYLWERVKEELGLPLQGLLEGALVFGPG